MDQSNIKPLWGETIVGLRSSQPCSLVCSHYNTALLLLKGELPASPHHPVASTRKQIEFQQHFHERGSSMWYGLLWIESLFLYIIQTWWSSQQRQSPQVPNFFLIFQWISLSVNLKRLWDSLDGLITTVFSLIVASVHHVQEHTGHMGKSHLMNSRFNYALIYTWCAHVSAWIFILNATRSFKTSLYQINRI